METPFVLVDLADLEDADLDALLAGELVGSPVYGTELAEKLAEVMRATGTAAGLAHRLGAHAALLAD